MKLRGGPRFRGNSEEAQRLGLKAGLHHGGMNTAQEAPQRLARPDGTAIRVLVVDDEPTLAEVLASVLRYEGWEVAAAADGACRGADRPRVPALMRSSST